MGNLILLLSNVTASSLDATYAAALKYWHLSFSSAFNPINEIYFENSDNFYLSAILVRR